MLSYSETFILSFRDTPQRKTQTDQSGSCAHGVQEAKGWTAAPNCGRQFPKEKEEYYTEEEKGMLCRQETAEVQW